MLEPQPAMDPETEIWSAVHAAGKGSFEIPCDQFSRLHAFVEEGGIDHFSFKIETQRFGELLLKERPSRGLELMRALGILKRNHPELEVLAGVPQDPIYHPEGDVWTHTMMVVDAAADIIREPGSSFTEEHKLQIMLGALCHDFGKPGVTVVEGERVRSPGHEAAGVEPATAFLSRFDFGEAIRHAVAACTKMHLQPSVLYRQLEKGHLTEVQYEKAIRTVLRRIHPVDFKVFLAVAEADQRGRGIKLAERTPYPAGELFARTALRHISNNAEGID